MKQLFLYLFLLLVSAKILAQSDQKIKSPIPGDELFATPSVTAFQSNSFLPTNLYTGKLNVDIPIFTIKSGNLNVPISISYNASGIKLDEYASNVGMGWNLNAGGSIIRIVKDIEDHKITESYWSEPDDDFGVFPYAYISQKGYLKDCGDYVNENTAPVNSPQAFWKSPCNNRNMRIDASPDMFFVNASGISSSFYLTNGTNGNYIPKDLRNSGNKYDDVTYGFTQNTAGFGFHTSEVSGLGQFNFTIGDLGYGLPNVEDYEEFKVTNTNGIKYFFGNAYDLVETVPNYIGAYSSSSGLPSMSVFTGKNYYDIQKTTWHLDKMEDAATGKKILFNYEKYSRSIINKEISYTDDKLTPNMSSVIDDNNYCVYGSIPDYFSVPTTLRDVGEYGFKRQKTYVKYPKINRIQTISFDEGTVEFIYGLNRQDYLQDKALTDIIIRDFNSKVIKKITLQYSYFISKENCNQPECKRLKLDKVIVKSPTNNILHEYALDYYQPNTLPKVKSLEQDYLGYYNANGVSTTGLKTPTLYYHPNNGKYSILPFPLAGTTSQTISGDYSMSANTNSLKGVLKSIQYPLGGTTTFFYENHTFMLQGNQYRAGGTRIRKQVLDDGKGNIVEKRYKYENANGNQTSGYINNLPIYGTLFTRNRTNNQVSFITYNKSKNALEMTSGAFVGYNRVVESLHSSSGTSNGFTVYEFTSPNEYPNIDESYTGCISMDFGGQCRPIDQDCMSFLLNNSAYPDITYQDTDILRGKIVKQTTYTNDGIIVQEIENEYTYTNFETLPLSYNFVNDTYRHFGSSEPHNLASLHTSSLKVERNLQTKQITKEYLDGETKTTENYYKYDNTFPFLTKQRTVDEIGEAVTEYYYPISNDVSNLPQISGLVALNKIGEVLKTKTKKDNLLTSTTQIEFFNFDYTMVLPKKVKNSKGSHSLETKSTIDFRDTNGNVKQYTIENGLTYVIVWGYKKSLPIAKISNATYTQVNTWLDNEFDRDLDYIIGLSNADQDETSENTLRIWLDRLHRAVEDQNGNKSQVETFTYDPLIGMTSATDVKGYTIFYEYDEFNRLKSVRDADGNMLSKNEYNYGN